MRGQHREYVAKVTLLFAVYFVTARIGLSLGAVSGFATTVWPPTGIALAALLVLGYRYWPGVATGAFLVNLVTGAAAPVAVGISLGNTLEALLGAFLLTRFVKIDFSLERVKDVLGLIFFAGILSTLVSPTIGTASLLAGDALALSDLQETWLAWWIGDVLGALVVAPLLLVWSTRLRAKIDPHRFVQAMVPIGLLVSASLLVFFGLQWLDLKPFSLAYIVYPLLVWMVLRFDQRGSVTAIFIVSLIAIWGTVSTYPSDAPATLSETLLLLQSFVGVTAATFMIMAAVVCEREQTYKQKQKLIQKTARLQALNEAKDEFISIASHQLRTPATGVKQYLGMLLESYAGNLNRQQRKYVKTAYESNERQLRIIHNLLDIARLDAGKLRPHKSVCNMTELVDEVVSQQTKEFKKRKQTLVFAPGKRSVNVLVDKELLRMVIENLVDNAGKYSGESKQTVIKITRANGHVHLRISDKGIGITTADQKKLFQKFSRISNSETDFIGGSGLGLYWAKRVVDMHDGTITLTSVPNRGSTFTVSLPAKPIK